MTLSSRVFTHFHVFQYFSYCESTEQQPSQRKKDLILNSQFYSLNRRLNSPFKIYLYCRSPLVDDGHLRCQRICIWSIPAASAPLRFLCCLSVVAAAQPCCPPPAHLPAAGCWAALTFLCRVFWLSYVYMPTRLLARRQLETASCRFLSSALRGTRAGCRGDDGLARVKPLDVPWPGRTFWDTGLLSQSVLRAKDLVNIWKA